jgi:hypothetical protein
MDDSLYSKWRLLSAALILQHWFFEVYTHGFVDWGRKLQMTPWGVYTQEQKLRCSASHAATCVAFFGYPKRSPANISTRSLHVCVRYWSPLISYLREALALGGIQLGELHFKRLSFCGCHQYLLACPKSRKCYITHAYNIAYRHWWLRYSSMQYLSFHCPSIIIMLTRPRIITWCRVNSPIHTW